MDAAGSNMAAWFVQSVSAPSNASRSWTEVGRNAVGRKSLTQDSAHRGLGAPEISNGASKPWKRTRSDGGRPALYVRSHSTSARLAGMAPNPWLNPVRRTVSMSVPFSVGAPVT